MASLCNDRNGNRRILFVDGAGNRKCIRLGKVDKRSAEVVLRHVENLLGSRLAGVAPPKDTAQWLGGISDGLRCKLAKAALIEGQPGMPTVAEYAQQYLQRQTHIKPVSLLAICLAVENLKEYFGQRPLDSISRGDCEDFKRWLLTEARRRAGKGKGLSPATVGKRIQYAACMFKDAVDRQLIARNPFVGVRRPKATNPERQVYVPAEVIERVIDYMPDPEWKLLVSMARYMGLRVPSEAFSLTWDCVNWDSRLLRVPSPKTERVGKPFRIAPIPPQVWTHLDRVWQQAPQGSKWVFERLRQRDSMNLAKRGFWAALNLRKGLQTYLTKAGIRPWPKLWQALRASAATDLATRLPGHVVSAMLGHTQKVAEAHYLMVTEEHYRAVAGLPPREGVAGGANCGAAGAQIAAQQPSVTIGKIVKLAPQPSADFTLMPTVAERNCLLHKDLIGATGLEPVFTSADSTTTCEKPQTAGGAKSGAVDAENDLTTLARALLELSPEDRRRLLKIIEQGGETP